MTTATRRIISILGLAVVVPVVIACSTASNSPMASNTGPESGQTAGRQMFSPDVRGDPHARTQWEASVQALELECRRNGKFCEEAAQGRLAISRKRSRI